MKKLLKSHAFEFIVAIAYGVLFIFYPEKTFTEIGKLAEEVKANKILWN